MSDTTDAVIKVADKLAASRDAAEPRIARLNADGQLLASALMAAMASAETELRALAGNCRGCGAPALAIFHDPIAGEVPLCGACTRTTIFGA